MRSGGRVLAQGATASAVFTAGWVHATQIGGYPFTGTSRFAWLVTFAVVLNTTGYAAGLPEVPSTLRSAGLSAFGAAGAAAGLISIGQLVLGSLLLPRFVVFWGAAAAVALNLIGWSLSAGGWRRAEERDRVMVVAGADESSLLRRDMSMSPERPSILVGACLPDADLLGLAETTRANLVVLDRTAAADSRVVEQVAILHAKGIRVRTLTLFYEQWLGKLPVSELERISMMFDIGEVHRARYARMRRVIDVIAGTTGLVQLVLLIPFVAVGNLVANRGPLFHVQERVGRDGAPFRMYKFRTMREGSDQTWSGPADPRVTPFGRFLRRTHVDEMPQFLNVIRGQLSLVGPRPEQPAYVKELREKIPFYDLRHLVRPGMTGWAQVKYGYSGDEQGAVEKLQYDFFYLRHQGLRLDARIVGRTLRAHH